VLLWGIGVLSILPLAAAPIGLFLDAREKFGERRWPAAAARLLGALLAGIAWSVAAGYCAYRGYRAIP